MDENTAPAASPAPQPKRRRKSERRPRPHRLKGQPSTLESAVRDAVTQLGGPTRVAILLGVSGTVVQHWMRQRHMPTTTESARERLKRMAQLTGESVARLAGLQD